MKSLKFWLWCIIIFWSVFVMACGAVGISNLDFRIGSLGIIAMVYMILCIYMEMRSHPDGLYKLAGSMIIIVVTLFLGYFTYWVSLTMNSSLISLAEKQEIALFHTLFVINLFLFAYMISLLITNRNHND